MNIVNYPIADDCALVSKKTFRENLFDRGCVDPFT